VGGTSGTTAFTGGILAVLEPPATAERAP